MKWNKLSEFKFWCQKVLPLVYDDSLSYYEVLCKVVDYINKMLENEQNLYDLFKPFVDNVEGLQNEFEQLQKSVNTAIATLNEKCNTLDNKIDAQKDFFTEYIDNISYGLEQRMSSLETDYSSIMALCTSIQQMVLSGDTVTLNRSKQYTNEQIAKLKKQLISNVTNIYVVDPIDGEVKNIQYVINELYEYVTYMAFTCWDFDKAHFTCEYLDGIGYTCIEFDMYGAFLIGSNIVTIDMLADYVKREELEYYALKTDLNPYAKKTDLILYNPVTGFKNTMQQVINTLVSFHACGNNCHTLDGLEYTASEYDSVGFTAYQFDFLGIIRKCGKYISPVTGLKEPLQMILNELAGLHQIGITCTEFDSLNADCDTIDAIEFTAYDFDFNGLVVFANAGYVAVTTGVTATQYQNFVVDAHGFVRVLDLV